MTHSRSLQRAFTLLEVLVVVSVIAILGAVAMVGYQEYVSRARAADIVLKYDAIRSGAGTLRAQGVKSRCADVPAGLGDANLKDDYARLAYGYERVADGYRPVLTVCAKADRHGELGVRVARGAHTTLAQLARWKKVRSRPTRW